MQPDLNNLKSKIQANRDLIDRIAVGIPFFKGYVEKAENYDADRIIRSFIVDKINSSKKTIGIVSGDQVRNGNLESTGDFEFLSNLLEGLVKKVEFADYGSGANFSKVKVSDDDQNRLLEYDWRLISSYDEISAMIDSLPSVQADSLKGEINTIRDKIRVFEKDFDERKYVIMEVI